MAESLTATVKLSVIGTLASDIDIGSRSHSINYVQTHIYANGTGADQANNVWSDTRTLTASSTENLDLAGGLSNAFGTTLTFTKIKAIIVHAASANTNNVIIGGAASNALVNWVGDATDTITIRPGGTIALCANDATAYAVTAGTGDILKVANSAGSTSVTYDIIVIGVV